MSKLTVFATNNVTLPITVYASGQPSSNYSLNFDNISLRSNNTGFHDHNQYARNLAAVTVWFTVTTFIGAIGAVLLILLLLSTVHQRKHRIGTRLLILHLMLMQLLLLGFIYPVLNTQTYLAVLDEVGSNGNATAQPRSRPPIHCPSVLFLLLVSVHAEAWASLLLAVNRLIASVLPHYYGKLTTNKAVVMMLALPWCIGLGGNLPLWFGVGAQFTVDRPYPTCTVRTTGGAYATVWVALGAYIPISLMGLAYGTLLLQLMFGRHRAMASCSNTSQPGMGQSSEPSLSRGARTNARALTVHASRVRQIALTKMLLCLFVWYTVCSVPTPVVISTFTYLLGRYYALSLWLSRTLVCCALSASPVSEVNT